MASTYDVGTRAWQPDAAEGWVASELVNKTVDGTKVKLEFQLENGNVSTRTPQLFISLILI
jgi:myosin-5